ncbi:MAG: hypothetical protein CMA58_04180 [Euryarchaeota archaeon]|jgi:hypothetical protein|nr:hypothetical protein [Euryarchaeota archaeon]|tara:strand:+ start:1794 stop:2804 length:1011 start_codon:yes stop_codon:yes gene_type:complete
MGVGGNLLKRFHLAIIIICQVTIVPTFLFSIAYLIDIDLDNASIGLRTEMISWIFAAGITYGIISLGLALIMSGYTPFYISNNGGWLAVTGLSRRNNDPELIDRARLSAYKTPHGTMSRLVHKKIKRENYDIMTVHGGLQLLAIPLQVILIAVPLIIMEGVPKDLIKSDSAFQLGIIGYLIALWAAIRIHPLISSRLIGVAYLLRNILGRFGRISWTMPLILYWIFARFFLALSLNWLGVDYEQWHEMQLEKIIIQTVVDEAIIPEKALLDSIVAISVLPMATFTTFSVLSGMKEMPEWMLGQEEKLENVNTNALEASNTREEKSDDDPFGFFSND